MQQHDSNNCCLQSLVWINGKIIFCTSLEYCIFDPNSGGVQPLFFLQEDAISRTIIAQLPGAKKALLSMASNCTSPHNKGISFVSLFTPFLVVFIV
jgi:hypothetical protein